MWISKKKYAELLNRIETLEKENNLGYGFECRDYYFLIPQKPKFYKPSNRLDGCEYIKIQDLVCKMANHLGFSFEHGQPKRAATKGQIKEPPAPLEPGITSKYIPGPKKKKGK